MPRSKAPRTPFIHVAIVALLALLAACSAPPGADHHARLTLPSLTADRILADPGAQPARELTDIERGLDAERAWSGRLDERIALAAHLRLAYLRLELRDLSGARRELESARRVPMDSADATALAALIRARVLAAEGAWSDAHASLDEALAVRGTSAATRHYLNLAEIDFRPPESPATEASVELPTLADGALTILPRKSWNSDASRPSRMTAMGRPSRITIHHSVTPGPIRLEASKKLLRAIQHDHQHNQGWGDIGYHYLIDRAGNVFEGRPLAYQGAHAGDAEANAHNVGICLLGNYDDQRIGAIRPEIPTRAQLLAMMQLVRSLQQRYSIPAQRIYTHREIHPRGPGATECPGATLQRIVETMRARFAQS